MADRKAFDAIFGKQSALTPDPMARPDSPTARFLAERYAVGDAPTSTGYYGDYRTDPENKVEERGIILPGAKYSDGKIHPAWPAIVHDAWQGMKAFETADPTDNSPEATARLSKAAFDAAGLAMTGSLAVPRPSNAVGTFGGKLAKTADHAKLAEAEKMAAAGADRQSIWDATGWFQGPDQKWRFEIDDSKFFVKGGDLPMSETARRWGPHADTAIYHPKLMEAYPELGSDTIVSGMNGTGGSFSSGPLRDPVLSVSNDLRGKAKNSVALHELQHGVQSMEQFPDGANPAFGHKADDVARAAQAAYEANQARAKRPPTDDDLLLAELGIASPDVSKPWADLTPRQQMEWWEAGRGRLYNQNAGEVEARAVQKRMDLTPEQRQARPPWLDYDVPEKDQIVRFGNSGTQQSAGDFLKERYGSSTSGAGPTGSAVNDPAAQAKSFWDAVKPLDTKLDGTVARAMDDWVGGGADAMARGVEGGLMVPGPLESLPPQQLDAMAAPVRDLLRQTYGDTITVYRGEGGGNPSTGRTGALMSYTTDPQVAERFAGVQHKALPIISDAEIAAAERQLATAGDVSIAGKTYRQQPGQKYVDIIDRDGNFVTDTDSLRTELAGINEWRAGRNAQRDAALKNVRAVELPVDQVVWATDRFGQKEIIARPPSTVDRTAASTPATGSLNQTTSPQDFLRERYGADQPEPLRAYRGVNVGDQFGAHPEFGADGTVFATSNPSVAGEFAFSGLPSGVKSPATYPVDMRFQNPMVKDMRGRIADLDPIAERAKKQGHDGLIVKNVKDTPDMRNDGPVADVYAALKPGTVYSSTTGDLLYSNPKTSAAVPVGVKAVEGNAAKNAATHAADDYRGQHGAPDHESGSPLHDVTANGIYPSDFYGPMGRRYYGTGDDEMDRVAFDKIMRMKDKPDELVAVWRAIPEVPGKKKGLTLNSSHINPGDWVAISRQYAVDHGESALNGKYHLVKGMKPARELFTAGDSIHEWGWSPQRPTSD